MNNLGPSSVIRRPILLTAVWGLLAGLLAGLAMLATMALLRWTFGWPTPTELIFDRLFPLLTVKFFIGSLVKAGGYTPLKLRGVYGALAGQMAVAGLGGMSYALFLRSKARLAGECENDPMGWRLIAPGILVATVLFVVLLWPTLLTNYRGVPPSTARWITGLEMLIGFSVCGIGIIFFYSLLDRQRAAPITRQGESDVAPPVARRRFLALGVGAGIAVVLGGILRRFFHIGTFSYDGTQYSGPQVQKITPNEKFYQVSKNLIDPDVTRDTWRLDIIGEVENPRVYSFAELAAMPAVEQETTLLCISYGIGSGLCSNAVWKGVPLPSLLAQVKPKPNVTTVLFHAADGYYETFHFAKAVQPTTLLAYEMNGAPLPQRHGFPLRMIVPGLYGEKNPKWLTRIELLNDDDARLQRPGGYGFYKEQGWANKGDVVPTHSRFDAPEVAGNQFAKLFTVGQPIEFHGMAFGGDRGITKVEVSNDGGETWKEARITQPGTKISWSLWSHKWTPEEEGKTKLVVRATDGEGQPQIAEYRDQVPDGATGLHWVMANVEKA